MTQPNPDNEPELSVEKTRGPQGEETTYHVRRDESVAEAVVRVVSSVTQTEQTGLEPLYSKVDPDALNALFTSPENGVPRPTDGVVAFDYAGNHIEITADGTINITDGRSE